MESNCYPKISKNFDGEGSAYGAVEVLCKTKHFIDDENEMTISKVLKQREAAAVNFIENIRAT